MPPPIAVLNPVWLVAATVLYGSALVSVPALIDWCEPPINTCANGDTHVGSDTSGPNKKNCWCALLELLLIVDP